MREKIFLPLTLTICAPVFAAWYQFFYETTAESSRAQITSVQAGNETAWLLEA